MPPKDHRDCDLLSPGLSDSGTARRSTDLPWSESVPCTQHSPLLCKSLSRARFVWVHAAVENCGIRQCVQRTKRLSNFTISLKTSFVCFVGQKHLIVLRETDLRTGDRCPISGDSIVSLCLRFRLAKKEKMRHRTNGCTESSGTTQVPSDSWLFCAFPTGIGGR